MSVEAHRIDFTGCCGTEIVYAFSGGGEAGTNLKSFQTGRIYIAILNEAQAIGHKYGEILEKAEFRLVSDNTVNKNTGNRLYVYLRDPVTRKKEPLKKRVFG